jgi:tetratricopeptide (TPR) repeat protein
LPTTVNRNWLWAEPLELTRLTHQQNPANPTVWSIYAVMLANQEFYNEARDEFKKVLEQHPDHLFTHESLASMELYIHDPEASRTALEPFFNKDLKADRKILQVMLECNQERLKLNKNESGANVIRKELIETYLMLYEVEKQPVHLLQAAELALLNNDYDAAKNHLRELLKNVGLNTKISGKATSLLRTL